MRKSTLILLLGLFCLQAKAAVIYATKDGNWNSTETWGGIIPGESDIVIIDGYHVIVTDSQSVGTIRLLNFEYDLSSDSKLSIQGDGAILTAINVDVVSQGSISSLAFHGIALDVNSEGQLKVLGNIEVIRPESDYSNQPINITISNGSIIDVAGKMDLTLDVNNLTNVVNINLFGQSTLQVNEIYTIDVKPGNQVNFNINDNAKLITNNSLTMYKHGNSHIIFNHNSSNESIIGHFLNFNSYKGVGPADNGLQLNINNGKFTINHTLNITTTNIERIVGITVNNDAILDVKKDIATNCYEPNVFTLAINDSGSLRLGGKFLRHTNHGNLAMAPDANIVYYGDSIQVEANKVGHSTDQFQFSNIKIESASNTPIQLSGPLVFSKDMELSNGIIYTDETNKIIMEEGAKIIGGSPTAYIDGPVEKRGSAPEGFTFPLGNQGTYAPLSISAVNSSSAVYVAQYHKIPPPSAPMEDPLKSLAADQYWTLERDVNSNPVDVTLYWEDDAEAGIGNIDDARITYLNENTNEWRDLGQGARANASAGNMGNLSSNLLSCPPPVGIIKITIGNAKPATNSVLPVEFSSFKVEGINNQTVLKWTTDTELESSHYEIQHSTDGYNFEKIGEVEAAGNSTQKLYYEYTHKTPVRSKNYYRLLQMDLDGMHTYTNIRSVTFSAAEELLVAPNPIQSNVRIIGIDPATAVGTIEAFDRFGNLIFNQNVALQSGEVTLSSNDLNINQRGTYYIRVTDRIGTNIVTVFKE